MSHPKYWYRTTKFEPSKRNEFGNYSLDNLEWIGYNDRSDPNYTFENYLLTENAYIYTIYYFIKKNKVENFQLYDVVKKCKLTKNSKIIQNKLLIEYTCRDNLRCVTNNGCKIRSENMCIHFGWDYYMYIGSNHKCNIAEIEFGGVKIFIEEIGISPYSKRNDLL